MRCFRKLVENFGILRTHGLYRMLLVEDRREQKRILKGRSKFTDIFIYSTSEDYYILRLLYNFPIGFTFSWLIYYLAWNKINFADCSSNIGEGCHIAHPIWEAIVKWMLICSAALTYSFNPLVRSALICAVFSGLSSTGQGILSMYVVENLREGPIENIMHNFGISTKITICHLEIQARITKRRIELQAGPIEALLEKQLGNATSIGYKVVKSLKSLIQPFDDDMEEKTEEDDHLAAIIDTAQKLAERQLSSEGDEPEGKKVDMAVRPAWEHLKSQLGRAVARRFTQRCKLLFASSMDSCHKKFEDFQSICYENIPWPIKYFTCSRINSLSLCQANKLKKNAHSFCELGEDVDAARGEHETLFSPELDDQMLGLQNVSQQMKRQLQLNLHFQAVEAPEIERGYAISQLHSEVKHDVTIFRAILHMLDMLLSFLIIMFTYFVFKGCVESTISYLSDIDYRNYFITRYFWRIDDKRERIGKPFLRPLRKDEIKQNKISGPFGCPRVDEVRKMFKSFFRWSAVSFIAVIVMMVDHYFFRMLEIVVVHGRVIRHQIGETELNIDIRGKGVIADLLRNVLNLNYTAKLDESLSNAHCLEKPLTPNWDYNSKHIIIPLLLMLFLQVFLNFVLQRLILFFVMGFIFPRRAKARIIYLYNKMLFARVNMDHLAKVQEEKEEVALKDS